MSSILLATLALGLAAPLSDAPRFGEMKLSTGIRMHYAEQGESRGEPIILLHGYSDSWFSFSRVLTPLARETRVYALDLRGHGKTDKPTSGYLMRDIATDVVAFMDAARVSVEHRVYDSGRRLHQPRSGRERSASGVSVEGARGRDDRDRRRRVARAFGIPTLVVRGEKDAWVTVEETDSLAKMVAAKRQKTYANTGHAVHWERPAEFASDVVAFRKET